ncbi:MAG TPA: tRNA (N6-isopentenyl adenosine(37)-C2)-methylthiotransferase MiaB [Candidatus Binataceae bacterium]
MAINPQAAHLASGRADSLGPASRVYLETYGCQMNIADSQLVGAILRQAGFSSAERAEDADIVLLNTCAIRDHAEERVLKRVRELAALKRRAPHLKIGLLGCMAQHNRAQLLDKAPLLDLVAGPDTYRRLPELLGRSAFDPTVDVRLDREETYADISPDYVAGVRAYVTVMRGCDKFCAFCVVPYVRGRERSIPSADLVREIKALSDRGTKEIVLLGQTVNAYHCEGVDFGCLLAMVARIDGIERIRFTSPHPADMTDSVIAAMAAEPKVQPHLHLPVQSGSDRILAAMGRGYDSAAYLKLVERLRGAVPGLALSTDVMVGFHGERESDFRASLDLMRTVGFDSAFMFKYSLRENTRAFALGDTVAEEEKSRRLRELIDLQERISLQRNQASIGSVFEVLIEGSARRGENRWCGKTPQFKTAIFDAAPGRGVGDTIALRIDSATAHTLLGEAADKSLGIKSAQAQADQRSLRP